MNADDMRLSAIVEDIKNVAGVLEQIAIQADADAPVLLLGPRSTGAGLLAEMIHATSDRDACTFVTARCGLYSGELLEARLFGRFNPPKGYHRATASNRGTIASADGGSLFVEQIQNATPSVQARLLELIARNQYADYERRTTYKADMRLIASARFELASRAKSGHFMRELLSQFTLQPIELNASCATREGILGVIELLRLHRPCGIQAQLSGWWERAACGAIQDRASERLRRAVELVALQLPDAASARTVLIGALRYMRRPPAGALRLDAGRHFLKDVVAMTPQTHACAAVA
jgi:sigma54-dependent transcription regulator